MKPGTLIKLEDGRLATVVYHGPDGYGVRFGEISLTKEDIELILRGPSCLPIHRDEIPPAWLLPEAMLRDPSLEYVPGLPCVGERFTIMKEPEI